MSRTLLVLALSVLAALLGNPPNSAASPPSAEQVLSKLAFPPDAKQRVAAGEFVQVPLETASERDLNVGIAFVVMTTPDELVEQVVGEGLAIRSDSQTKAHGRLGDPGSIADLSKLELTKAQQSAYAQPGDGLNLSADEISTLQAAQGGSALSGTVREALLARYQAYRAKGLQGIAPYRRAGADFDPAEDLRAANTVSAKIGLLPQSFHDLLGNYPSGAPADLKEAFSWSQLNAHDEDTLALTHYFAGTFGGVMIVVDRQYYVSTGYNTVQAVTAFLPVEEGTLVVYTNHTSTDQVAGFGGSAKRGIGRKFMAAQLEDLFERSRASAE